MDSENEWHIRCQDGVKSILTSFRSVAQSRGTPYSRRSVQVQDLPFRLRNSENLEGDPSSGEKLFRNGELAQLVEQHNGIV